MGDPPAPGAAAPPNGDNAHGTNAMPMLPIHTHTAVAPLLPFIETADPATAAPRWKAWIGRLNHYFKGTRETDGTVKRSPLILYGGAEIYDLFETLPNTGDDDDYDAAVAALNRHFDPQLNSDFEKFKFKRAWQTETESVDMFYARLLASSSELQSERS